MKASDLKRHVFRGVLSLHFVGLALTIGVRFASFAIYRTTSAADLQTMAFGRDLVGGLARGLTLPGFLLTVLTGVAMVLLRYGRRPPVWVWIKVALTTGALAVATPIVGPALEAARHWAHWSLEHGQLAVELQASVAKANLYGGIVFLLFILNIPVAIWKPFSRSERFHRPQRDSGHASGQKQPQSALSDQAEAPKPIHSRAMERRA